MSIGDAAQRRTRLVVAVAVLAGALVLTLLVLWPAYPGREPAPPRDETGTPTQATPSAPPVLTPRRVRFVTANVPFTLTGADARSQFAHVLLPGADIVVMNEVKHRRVADAVADLQPGRWNVFQPPGAKAETAVLWRSDRFTALDRGVRLGSGSNFGDARFLPWVVLHDRLTGRDVTVVGVHFPTNASKYAGMRARYLAMNDGLTALVGRLSRLGHPIVAAGDWNHPLRQTREAWSPVPVLASLGLTTNWRRGLPCRGTSHFLGQIDGFAFSPGLRLDDQGCLSRLHSDHRPVWMDLDLATVAREGPLASGG